MTEYKLEIWQKTPLIDRSQVILDYQGRSRFDRETEKRVFESFTGVENYPIINLRAVIYNHQKQTLYLDVGESLFAEHVVLNKTDKIANGRGIALEERVLPLTVVGVSVTQDEKVIFSSCTQNGTVTVGETSLLPGGYMHTWDRNKDNKLDPWEVALREFAEETGVPTEQITSLKGSGLIYSDDINRGFVIPFELRLSAESGVVEEKYKKASDPETEAIHLVPFKEGAIFDFVKERLSGMSNHALGTLLLVGNNRFGSDWYKEFIDFVRKGYGGVLELDEELFRKRADVREIIKAHHS